MSPMRYEDVIQFYGSQAAVARALKLSQPSVWGWKGGDIPIERQIQIELATGGILKADLPPEIRQTRKPQQGGQHDGKKAAGLPDTDPTIEVSR